MEYSQPELFQKGFSILILYSIAPFVLFVATSGPVTEEQSEWPDDGLGLGSYPKLPNISAQIKPPNGWWDMQERRNYGDTVRPSLVHRHLLSPSYLASRNDCKGGQVEPDSSWLDRVQTKSQIVCFFSLFPQLHEEDDALNVWMYDAPEKSLYPP